MLLVIVTFYGHNSVFEDVIHVYLKFHETVKLLNTKQQVHTSSSFMICMQSLTIRYGAEMILPMAVRALSLYGGQKTFKSKNFSRICTSSADHLSWYSENTETIIHAVLKRLVILTKSSVL